MLVSIWWPPLLEGLQAKIVMLALAFLVVRGQIGPLCALCSSQSLSVDLSEQPHSTGN